MDKGVMDRVHRLDGEHLAGEGIRRGVTGNLLAAIVFPNLENKEGLGLDVVGKLLDNLLKAADVSAMVVIFAAIKLGQRFNVETLAAAEVIGHLDGFFDELFGAFFV